MNSESPLILTLDLQVGSLCLTIFDTCGLAPIYTAKVDLSDFAAVSHLESIVGALDAVIEQAAASLPSLLCRVKVTATTAAVNTAAFLTSSASLALSQLSPYERLQPQLEKCEFFALQERVEEDNIPLDNGDTANFTFPFPTPLSCSGLPLRSMHQVTEQEKITSSSIDWTQSFASQICKLANSPAWDLCSHVLPIGTFLDSLLLGRIAPCNTTQASSTDFYDGVTAQWNPAMTQVCSQDQTSKLIDMLPTICALADTSTIGPWLVRRFGFCSDCVLVSSLPSVITAYVSFLPSRDDAVLHFGTSDEILLSMDKYRTLPDHSTLVNPLYSFNDGKTGPWLALFRQTDADQARCNVRNTYTKTWKAFNQLVQVVCPGGSVGLDNKLFTLFVPTEPCKGLRRFEHGTRVAEFDDLRANPRCVIEGQALQIRKVVGQIKWQDQCKLEGHPYEYRGAASCLSFNPWNTNLKTKRWYTWGRAAGNERIAEVYAHVLGACVMADAAEVKYCVEQDQNSDTAIIDKVTRPSWGACFLAAYILEQSSNGDAVADFDTCIQTLMTRMPVIQPHRPLRRVRSTLASVKEDEGDVDTSACHSSDEMSPGTSVARNRRSLTVSVPASHLSSLSPPTGVASSRERSLSCISTTLHGGVSPSPCHTDASTTATSLLSSPRWNSTRSPLESKQSAQEGEGIRGLIQLAESDDDLWDFYGSMLEEYIRLSDTIDGK